MSLYLLKIEMWAKPPAVTYVKNLYHPFIFKTKNIVNSFNNLNFTEG